MPFARRDAPIDALLERHGARCAYVVSRHREELLCGEQRMAVHLGMLPIKATAGREHPFMRAVAPLDQAPPRLVVDATLGLAGDALHLAWVLGCEVLGFELSPVVYSLVEEGLERLAAEGSEAATRVKAAHTDALKALAALPRDEADVIFVNPMFDQPRKAAPGFHLLREVAACDALPPQWVDLALEAAPRVVFRLPRGQEPPPELRDRPVERVCGKAVDYMVLERRRQ